VACCGGCFCEKILLLAERLGLLPSPSFLSYWPSRVKPWGFWGCCWAGAANLFPENKFWLWGAGGFELATFAINDCFYSWGFWTYSVFIGCDNCIDGPPNYSNIWFCVCSAGFYYTWSIFVCYCYLGCWPILPNSATGFTLTSSGCLKALGRPKSYGCLGYIA